MIPATQNAHTTLQTHCAALPQPTTPPRPVPPRPRGAPALRSPFCPSRRKSAIWSKMQCLSTGGAGALAGKVWWAADETRQVPGGVHGTPRRGVWTANSQATCPNHAIENLYFPDWTLSFTPISGGG